MKISKPVLLKDAAKAIAVPAENLEGLNPELRLKTTPPRPYELRVPEGKGQPLLVKLNEIPESKASEKLYTTHTVQRGDTLFSLSRRYSCTVQALAELNRIRPKDPLRAGQKLKVPAGTAVAGKEAEGETEAVAAVESEPLRHRVKTGETLWKIVQHYKTSLEETMRLNRLETTQLRTDQVLLIPAGK